MYLPINNLKVCHCLAYWQKNHSWRLLLLRTEIIKIMVEMCLFSVDCDIGGAKVSLFSR